MKERIIITIEWRKGKWDCQCCPFEKFRGGDEPCRKCMAMYNGVNPMHPVILSEEKVPVFTN